MIDPHARQPNDVANYIWIVLVAVIVFLVILAIIGGRTLLKKREARRKRQADAKVANDEIFNPILRAPLTAPAPSRPGRAVHDSVDHTAGSGQANDTSKPSEHRRSANDAAVDTNKLAPVKVIPINSNSTSLFPLAQPPLLVVPTPTNTSVHHTSNYTSTDNTVLIDHPLPTPTCLFCIPRHSMVNLLPAILILLALFLATAIALIISFRRHRSPSSSSSFFSSSSWSKHPSHLPPPTTMTTIKHEHLQPFLPQTRSPSPFPSPYHHHQPYLHLQPDPKSKTLPTVTVTENPSTTPDPSTPQITISYHPSLKRKRALTAGAARSVYALPIPVLRVHPPSTTSTTISSNDTAPRDSAHSPTHTGADWRSHLKDASSASAAAAVTTTTTSSSSEKAGANYEDIHLAPSASPSYNHAVSPAPGFVFPAAPTNSGAGSKEWQGHGRTASESVWAERARRVAARHGQEEKEEQEGLGAFDFEREAGEGKRRNRGAGAEGGLKGWRVSLFGRGEFAG